MTPLVGKTEIPENTRAHFECRVEPSRDPKMKISWYYEIPFDFLLRTRR